MSVFERLKKLEAEAEARLQAAADGDDVERVRVDFLGREGSVTAILRSIGDLPRKQRAEVGRLGNRVRDAIERQLEQARQRVEDRAGRRQILSEGIDITAPGRAVPTGRHHPLLQTLDEVLEVFVGMGYAVARGPEVEDEWHNFTGLNVPADHPARDMQDSFYVTDELVLRTQTSPIQLRYMQSVAPQLPVRIVGPGRVYRRGDDDVSHSPVFHQCEALLVDRHVTFGHLRGTLMDFAHRLFGEKVEVRFRPSYFPFTEPSAEVDVSCTSCHGKGCVTCGGSGFLEVLGAGMVHPRVLENGGYDPDEVSGFAFGMGIERLAMLKFGIGDIRYFYENDVRFLQQL
ncbi:MAG: phenylalanine--tRNA ligase subunit alpha [Bacillota bacterium]